MPAPNNALNVFGKPLSYFGGSPIKSGLLVHFHLGLLLKHGVNATNLALEMDTVALQYKIMAVTLLQRQYQLNSSTFQPVEETICA